MSTSGKSYLTGKFRHNLDEKNRVTIPSTWRSLFPKETTFLAIPNMGGYVTVLPPAEADKLYEKFAAVPLSDTEAQDEINAFMANTQAITFDSQGRIALSEDLFTHAGLKGPKQEVVMVGAFNKFNIFSPERWELTAQKSTSATQGDAMRRFGI